MIYYIFLSILSIFGLYNIRNKFLSSIATISFFIFLCLTYLNGSDWINYEKIYSEYSLSNFLTFPFEKAFSFYFSLFKGIGVDFWIFFIITKIICLYIFIKILKKFLPNYFLGLSVFYIQMGLYLIIDCPLRNLIAIALAFLSIDSLIVKKSKFFILYCILAILFHNSAIILIFYFIFYFGVKVKKIKIVLWCLFFISFLFTNKNFILYLIHFFRFIPVLYFRILNYFYGPYSVESPLNIRLIEKYLITFSSLVYYKDIKEKYKFGEQMLILNLFFLLCYTMAMTWAIFVRLSLYFRIFNIIILVYLIESFHNRILKYLSKIVYITYLFVNLYFLLKITNIYIPYTNYLEYIGKEKLSYEYRLELKKKLFNKN
ncbi:hypothetical protein FUSO7_09990 [Fusobacterium necrophorum BFTR-2]|uniref:EpsG family protein n=1 Tax=Fusobacterium necrophorum BL TaxID=1441732 RepID=A0AB73BYJ9_9FUSO|nr:EpsG family protein [Fusobacterium necrophorum]KDE65185.1 hypothetical protein FUSO3_01410 [Fusobacterium necrophorum BL]KDE71242.1 hypothetical protein FUSO7_09990 [Fusobacterium necrophorum BFTR-2]